MRAAALAGGGMTFRGLVLVCRAAGLPLTRFATETRAADLTVGLMRPRTGLVAFFIVGFSPPGSRGAAGGHGSRGSSLIGLVPGIRPGDNTVSGAIKLFYITLVRMN